MQLEGHGSYWKAKILKIQEFWLLRLLLKKKTVFFTGITPRDPMKNMSHNIAYKHKLARIILYIFA